MQHIKVILRGTSIGQVFILLPLQFADRAGTNSDNNESIVPPLKFDVGWATPSNSDFNLESILVRAYLGFYNGY